MAQANQKPPLGLPGLARDHTKPLSAAEECGPIVWMLVAWLM
jgi:hypothetical protein